MRDHEVGGGKWVTMLCGAMLGLLCRAILGHDASSAYGSWLNALWYQDVDAISETKLLRWPSWGCA